MPRFELKIWIMPQHRYMGYLIAEFLTSELRKQCIVHIVHVVDGEEDLDTQEIQN